MASFIALLLAEGHQYLNILIANPHGNQNVNEILEKFVLNIKNLKDSKRVKSNTLAVNRWDTNDPYATNHSSNMENKSIHYLLVNNSFYIVLFCKNDNPFSAPKLCLDIKQLLLNLHKVEQSNLNASRIEKKFGTTFLALTRILNGESIEYIVDQLTSVSNKVDNRNRKATVAESMSEEDQQNVFLSDIGGSWEVESKLFSHEMKINQLLHETTFQISSELMKEEKRVNDELTGSLGSEFEVPVINQAETLSQALSPTIAINDSWLDSSLLSPVPSTDTPLISPLSTWNEKNFQSPEKKTIDGSELGLPLKSIIPPLGAIEEEDEIIKFEAFDETVSNELQEPIYLSITITEDMYAQFKGITLLEYKVKGLLTALPSISTTSPRSFQLILSNSDNINFNSLLCDKNISPLNKDTFTCLLEPKAIEKMPLMKYELNKDFNYLPLKLVSKSQRIGSELEIKIQIAVNPLQVVELCDFQLVVEIPLLGEGADAKMQSVPEAVFHSSRKLLLWKQDKLKASSKSLFSVKFLETKTIPVNDLPQIVNPVVQVKFICNSIVSKLKVNIKSTNDMAPVYLSNTIERYQAHFVS